MSSRVLAAGIPPSVPGGYFNGIYGGIGGGIVTGTSRIGVAFSKIRMRGNNVGNNTLDLGSSDPDGFLFNGKLQTNTNLRMSTAEFDADLKLGILSSPHTLFYGLVGVAVNRIKFNLQNAFNISVQGQGISGGIMTNGIRLSNVYDILCLF